MSTGWMVIQADCVEAMRGLPENSVDSIVSDPPYGLEFMGKEWDRIGVFGTDGSGTTSKPGIGDRQTEWPSNRGWNDKRCAKCGHLTHGGSPCQCPEPDVRVDNSRWVAMQAWHLTWAREALRVLKPGGHLVAFGGTRTYHRLACALEDAGFELRDSLMWLYGTGFPKSLDVGKALAEWEGWGTALKPAFEPICLARKPLDGTVAVNVQKWGTGALNIDGCRVEGQKEAPGSTPPSTVGGRRGSMAGKMDRVAFDASTGRWPANVVLDEEAGALLDAQSGISKSSGGTGASSGRRGVGFGHHGALGQNSGGLGDEGGASRFFYCAKTSRSERNAGCGELWWVDGKPASKAEWDAAPKDKRGQGNNHPTVKPVALMRWLIRLVTPPSGSVLDPFCGSGSTGLAALQEGVRFIGLEREPAYVSIAKKRLAEQAADARQEPLKSAGN